MKKLFLFLLACLIVISCSKEKQTSNNPKNDRLSFKNVQEFNDAYLMLTQMTSREDKLFWAKSQNHSTLLDSDDSTLENYSDVLKTILNKDSEYELGDSIIWFNKGKFLAFSKKDAFNLKILKQNPEKCHISGYVSLIKIGDSKQKTLSLGLTSLDARNQHQFTQQYYQPCGGTRQSLSGTRKYVHEIFGEAIISNPGPVFYCYLYLRVKLEYKGSSGWKAAGEQRYISVNVSGTALVAPPYSGGNFNINQTYDCSGNRTFLLMNVNGAYTITPHWEVSMSGVIYQKVDGDVDANAWTNSGYNNTPYLWN